MMRHKTIKLCRVGVRCGRVLYRSNVFEYLKILLSVGNPKIN
jgi:hypothetical protein